MPKIPKELLFITTNNWKVSFANKRLNKYGILVKVHSVKLIEPQEVDINKVALHKAKQVLESGIGRPFIVEDSGLYINALNGFPGALIKPILDSIGDAKFLGLVQGQKKRAASIKNVLVYCDPKTKKFTVFVGECTGKLPISPKGKIYNGWTLSKIFMPYELKKTLAQMNKSEYQTFIKRLERNDHYEKFGKWITGK